MKEASTPFAAFVAFCWVFFNHSADESDALQTLREVGVALTKSRQRVECARFSSKTGTGRKKLKETQRWRADSRTSDRPPPPSDHNTWWASPFVVFAFFAAIQLRNPDSILRQGIDFAEQRNVSQAQTASPIDQAQGIAVRRQDETKHRRELTHFPAGGEIPHQQSIVYA